MSDSESLPSDIEELATQVVSTLLPEKSKIKYEQAYERLRKWCDEKKIKNEASEKVLLVYFENISKRYKPSSLWAYYSMIRAMISIKKNVDISKFIQLVAFLKRQSEGYKPKKSNILTKQHITRFLQEADDEKWLLTKVVLIFGIGGACRKEELTYMQVRNEGQVFCVTISNTKTKISREFVITSGDIDGINFVDIIKKYMAQCSHNAVERFSVGYRNGKCIKQPVGINTIGSMPKNIASFLKLPNAKEYTGHCFRRSSSSLLANSGADLLTIKRHGGWKSNTVAEGYIETSVENKKRIATNILGEKNVLVEASTSKRSSLEISKTEMSSACGHYPTMKPFTYCEELTFESLGQPLLNYSSKTWHPIEKHPMHFESGFLRINPGTCNVAFMVSHKFGVVSLEEGTVTGNTLNLRSVTVSHMSFGKEPTVTGIVRSYEFFPDTQKLNLVVSMATSNTDLTEHLRVEYEKVK